MSTSILYDKGSFVVSAPFSMKNKLKAIPGRKWDSATQAWIYPATQTMARRIAVIMNGRDIEACDEFHSMLDGYKSRDNAIYPPGEVGQDFSPRDFMKILGPKGFATEPKAHQIEGARRILHYDSVYLNHDPGTGKTYTSIIATELLHPGLTLIVTPVNVIEQWVSQWATHSPRTPLTILPLDASFSSAAKARKLQSALRLQRPTVVITNYESVWRGDLGELILDQDWDLVIADEIHMIKSHERKARAANFFARLMFSSNKRVGLSGTIMPNDPMDVFSQYRFLDPGLFGNSFYAFRSQFAVMGGYGNKQVVAFRNDETMKKLMKTITHRVTKDEVLDLPSISFETRPCLLGRDARKLYADIMSSFKAELEDATISVPNALVELIRLQQITGGSVNDDDGNHHRVDSSKRDCLQGLLEGFNRDEPMVVFCRFHHDLDAVLEVCKKLGRTCGELSGRGKDLASFQKGNVDTLAVQVRSGGVGVELQRSAYAIFYSLGFSLGEYEQAVSRVHRQGQERRTVIYHLICKDTVDELVYSALQKKSKVVDDILDELRG